MLDSGARRNVVSEVSMSANGSPRASGWSSLTALWGFPCFVRFPCVHAAATTPAQRLDVSLAHFIQT